MCESPSDDSILNLTFNYLLTKLVNFINMEQTTGQQKMPEISITQIN
jgi:hypothetical protein